MNGHKEEEHNFEIGVAVPKRRVARRLEEEKMWVTVVLSFCGRIQESLGLIIERILGVSDEFIKVCGLSHFSPPAFHSCPNGACILLLQQSHNCNFSILHFRVLCNLEAFSCTKYEIHC